MAPLPRCAAAAVVPLLLLLGLTAVFVRASPPGPIVTCTSAGNKNCTVINAYATYPDRSTCRVAAAVFPTNESDVLNAVSAASKAKQKMKVSTIYAHSMPKLSCPGGPSGSGLVISTLNFNKVVSADVASGLMTFEPGVTLRQLVDAAAARGLALPYTPYWQGMTLGGLLATGSHGSSVFGKGSAVHEYVVGMRIVVATPGPDPVTGLFAKVVTLTEADADLLAAKVSFGVLGVVTQITLQLQPMFKRAISNRVQQDTGFETTIPGFAAATEFGDVTWYPSQARVVFRDDVRLPISFPGKGKNDFTGFRPQPSVLIATTRITEDIFELAGDSRGKCLTSKIQVTTLLETGQGLKNNDGSILEFTGYPVIGNQSDMQTSGSCLFSKEDNMETACGWDPRIRGLFYHQTTVSISIANISSFIADVKKLRDADPNSLCGTELYSGFLMRFVRGSTALLGKLADSVDIDITYYRARDAKTPRLNEDVLEEIEQMAVFKYKGLPHLGKNRNVAFLGFREKLGDKANQFVQAMGRFDPDGLFSSDWTDAVLGLSGKSLVIDADGCALEGLCICSKDSHCAPSQGYLCRTGKVYPEARVCRKTTTVAQS